MALRVLDTDKVSLKSGFDKYLSTDDKGKVQGRSDAIGARELWEPIFEEVSILRRLRFEDLLINITLCWLM